jgi:hypothetical protein
MYRTRNIFEALPRFWAQPGGPVPAGWAPDSRKSLKAVLFTNLRTLQKWKIPFFLFFCFGIIDFCKVLLI